MGSRGEFLVRSPGLPLCTRDGRRFRAVRGPGSFHRLIEESEHVRPPNPQAIACIDSRFVASRRGAGLPYDTAFPAPRSPGSGRGLGCRCGGARGPAGLDVPAHQLDATPTRSTIRRLEVRRRPDHRPSDRGLRSSGDRASRRTPGWIGRHLIHNGKQDDLVEVFTDRVPCKTSSMLTITGLVRQAGPESDPPCRLLHTGGRTIESRACQISRASQKNSMTSIIYSRAG